MLRSVLLSRGRLSSAAVALQRARSVRAAPRPREGAPGRGGTERKRRRWTGARAVAGGGRRAP